jgi:hypothetical protein
MALVQQIEEPVGEADAPAAVAPPLRLLHRLLGGDDFS